MKINLSNVAGGFNLQKINDNFSRIADTINNKILFRDNPAGEPNALLSDVDVNSKTLYNVGNVSTAKLTVAGKDVTDVVVGSVDAKEYAKQALTSATNSANSAASSANSASNSDASAVASNTARAEAVVAKNQAVAAWASATSPAEQLAAQVLTSHIGTAVKVLVGDTSKDSDGGLWRERCQDKSWFTEALGGNRWIGQQASVSAAWTAAGSTTGAVFQASATAGPLTVGKYYTATSASAATEVFRGISKDFPALFQVVAEANRVVIYDLTQPGCPMWMVLPGLLFDGVIRPAVSGCSITSLVYAQGKLIVGVTKSNLDPNWSPVFDFATGTVSTIGVGVNGRSNVCRISDRATAIAYLAGTQTASLAVVDGRVNDIAATVLPDAPLDPATGLLVPTIAAATAGGLSVIRHDGTVQNNTTSMNGNANLFNCSFDSYGNVYLQGAADRVRFAFAPAGNYGTYTALGGEPGTTATSLVSYPANPAMGVVNARLAASSGHSAGIVWHKMNPSTPLLSMLAWGSSTIPPAWQVGDSRGAWLIDTTAETLGPSVELVTNGTFATDVNGWESQAGGAIAWNAGAIRVSNPTAIYGESINAVAFPTVQGKSYKVAVSRIGGTGQGVWSVGTAKVLNTNLVPDNVGASAQFVATGAQAFIALKTGGNTSGAYYDFDNVSLQQIEPDRSVKNNGLNIIGTLTKAPVATGAQLVAYSGFSASNYLEQPYSANLDFGTGDFCVMGWIKSSSLGKRPIYHRSQRTGTGYGNNAVMLSTGNTGIPLLLVSDGGGTATQLNATSAYSLNQWMFVCGLRRSGVLEVYVNDKLEGSVANTYNLSNANAIAKLGGNWWNGSLPADTSVSADLTLVRTSATAPSADQIAQIYRDELALFQPNAQCTLGGTSNAVTALAYDGVMDVTHALTSYGRSSFRGFTRVESEATVVGTPTSIATDDGVIVTGGTNVRSSIPAIGFREDRKRRSEAVARVNALPQMFPTSAIAAQTVFNLPYGFIPRAVYSAGLLRVLGTDYTIQDDGYRKSVKFATAPGAGVLVNIFSVRG